MWIFSAICGPEKKRKTKETIVQFSQILTRIEKIKLMENIYYSINNTKRLFDHKWDPWFIYKNTPNA